MSRLGRTPIEIPKGVELKIGKDSLIQIKGPKGNLELHLPKGLFVKVEGTQAVMEIDEAQGATGALYGLYRSLLKNHILGVAQGYEVKLTMIGVGYRAAVQGNKLDLQVGFSHPTVLDIPSGVKVAVDKGTTIIVQGSDKKQVGDFAAAVRGKKRPEPYKGKGIRYENEYVRKKEGKAAKGKA